ncbi:uncharacterized protein LOC106180552 isoform X2 [Lingula anatina]|uniref:Superoxide dismutase n=1 Tax=Lingula anatina TaxID=7574 RepID=A0A1S3KBZ5_LINAN|nr:uncharacterized protein LOC106180552 isoform X2 [Lingula anatina]|eukprot:XP_013420017.1 uncharacterized protein LOC106180552 isoform X2 [Lingula anatina]
MAIVTVLFCVITLIVTPHQTADARMYEDCVQQREDYPLPPLPYSYNSLEPHMDATTVQIHHLKHHAAYTKKMNAALKQWRDEDPENTLATGSIVEILQHLYNVPEKYRTVLRNNGGGYVNHAIYFACMSSRGAAISQDLENDIIKDFGSYNNFTKQFTTKAMGLFGSGYVWLSRGGNDKLVISTTANQDSPVTESFRPILVIDIWEHAYYLKYQYRRADFVAAWWKLVDWKAVVDLDKWWRVNYRYG